MRLTLFFIAILFNATTLSGVELLVHGYYKEKCPLAEDIVRHNVEVALLKDPRLAASLLRLHFHDCFVMVTIFLFPPPLFEFFILHGQRFFLFCWVFVKIGV